jgi:hypothetical protein
MDKTLIQNWKVRGADGAIHTVQSYIGAALAGGDGCTCDRAQTGANCEHKTAHRAMVERARS